MDHFLHPWHYAPFLAALPFLPYWYKKVKACWFRDRTPQWGHDPDLGGDTE